LLTNSSHGSGRVCKLSSFSLELNFVIFQLNLLNGKFCLQISVPLKSSIVISLKRKNNNNKKKPNQKKKKKKKRKKKTLPILSQILLVAKEQLSANYH